MASTAERVILPWDTVASLPSGFLRLPNPDYA